MATGLCSVGLVSAGGESGVRVTATSTVREGGSLVPSIPSWPRGTPSSTRLCGLQKVWPGL